MRHVVIQVVAQQQEILVIVLLGLIGRLQETVNLLKAEIVHLHRAHRVKVVSVVLITVRDLAIVLTRLVHLVKVANVVLTTVKDPAIVHIHHAHRVKRVSVALQP